MTVEDAQRILEEYRTEYNTVRPHRSPDYLMPQEFYLRQGEPVTGTQVGPVIFAGALKTTPQLGT